MKRHLIVSGSRLALAIGVLTFTSAAASAQATSSRDANPQPPPSATGPKAQVPATPGAAPPNVIVVTGVRQAIQSALREKRNSSQIMDAITAEDIGQLANDNIAEALQRIPGVQIDRSNDGQGKQVQIRGLSENNVTINGATMTGTGDIDLSNGNDRGVNFQGLPAEMFSGVQILKAATADQIAGSLGGTINLQTRAPLKGKRDFILNLTNSVTYRDVGHLWRPSANLFIQKQWHDTPIGEIGVIMNFGYKRIASLTGVYGGGEYGGAPGVWERLSGANPLPTSVGPDQSKPNYNFFALANIPNVYGGSKPNPYQYAPVDVNGDGVANASDVVYVPNAFGESLRTRDDTRRSFNGTLEWKPAHNLDIRFDTVLTGLDQDLTGANVNIVSNAPRAGFLIGGPGNTFQQLENTPTFGPVYVMTGGRLGSFTTRVGAQPSINQTRRKLQEYTLQTTWDVSSNLSLFVEGTHSRGSATTLNFGQLNTGIEDQGGNNARFNTQDFYQIVDYNLGTNLIPDVTLYADPFPAKNWGVNSVVAPGNLTVLNPGDLSYERYRYYQYQRNAADTRNKDDSVRFDLNWSPTGGFVKALKFGFRWAHRGFSRRAYQNQNQGGGVYSAWDGVRPPVQAVAIQQIPLNPANTTDTVAQATSQFLESCLTTTSMQGILDQFGGNLPQTFGSTAGCDITAVQNYFNMIDIRAIDPNTGTGYYELVPERYSVGQDSWATYLESDFQFNIGSVVTYGNVGVRYVLTDTSSAGYRPVATTGNAYDLVTYANQYDDWLPSANINFALTSSLIARFAVSRTLGRPSLTQISPGIQTFASPNVPGYAGYGVAGNPNLKPIHSNNFDISLEWYYAKGSYVALDGFAKNIDTTIFLDPNSTDYTVGGKTYSIQTYENFGGTKIRGLEFSAVHNFTYLPGILSNFGVTGNITVIGEDSSLRDQEGDPISRKGLSHLTYNISGYYDDGRLSLRLAWNWRSKFTRVEAVQLGYNQPAALPEIEAARGELDFGARFKVNRNIRFFANANNLTDSGTFRYLKYPILVNYIANAGRSYNLGFAVSF